MRVAVTGANGLVGAAAVALLCSLGHDVLALGRGPSRIGAGPFTWVDADLGDGRSVEAALRDFAAAAVLHAGAMTDVDGCEREPERAWAANVGGSEQVVRQGYDRAAPPPTEAGAAPSFLLPRDVRPRHTSAGLTL